MGIFATNADKRPVTLRLDHHLVEALILLKESNKLNGEYFSISTICQQALRTALADLQDSGVGAQYDKWDVS